MYEYKYPSIIHTNIYPYVPMYIYTQTHIYEFQHNICKRRCNILQVGESSATKSIQSRTEWAAAPPPTISHDPAPKRQAEFN